MKRRLFKLVVFLLLGAIVNVAVAWGCATTLDLFYTEAVSAYRTSAEGKWQVEALRRVGATVIESARGTYPYGESESDPPPERLIPSWAPADLYSAELANHVRLIDARGFPMLSLWCEKRARIKIAPKFDVLGAIHTPLPPFEMRIPRALPLRSIWPGFAINTLFYATLLWLFILGPLALRGVIRRKRGLCLQCAYDLRGDFSSGCPECGWRRKEEDAGQPT